MSYVDGFVVAVPKDKSMPTSRWREKRAKCGRNTARWPMSSASPMMCPMASSPRFPRAVQAKEDEIVVFSWVVYDSREKRDAIIAKVMADPRLKWTMSAMRPSTASA